MYLPLGSNSRYLGREVSLRDRCWWPLVVLTGIAALSMSAGCQTPKKPSPGEALRSSNERHVAMFGDFELPRKLGTVENVNLQIPVISPDGGQILYLRTDQDSLSPMTLLGSCDPQDTPSAGTLSIWIRPTEGAAPGRRLSKDRWAHSAIWSDSGRSVAYVVNEPPASWIVHHDLATGTERVLGVPKAINCLPRFDGDDEAVLFCSGKSANGPFRVFRQTLRDREPTVLTPEGVDCVFPVASSPKGEVLCARVEGDHLNWARGSTRGMTDVLSQCGTSQRPALIQMWAGINAPLSPDGKNLLFYDTLADRISAYNVADQRCSRHRQGSIAACWLTGEAIALATADWVFAVNTQTGMSPQLLNDPWIPCRYVQSAHRLLLLGKDRAKRFSIVEVVFKRR